MKKLCYYRKTGRFVKREFWRKIKEVVPFEIKGVQTDNGSEFLSEFAKELEREGNALYREA